VAVNVKDLGRSTVVLAGVVALAVVLAPAPAAAGQADQSVTFTKDIVPVLQRSCQSCHRPGANAPMSLLTYEEVRPWASAIKRRTSAREMPPWFIEKNVGIQRFKDDPSLTDAEIQKIGRWVDNGAPRGNPADAPPPRQFPAGGDWSFGTPDLVVSSPVRTIHAVEADFQGDIGVTPTGLTEDRYVKAVEVREVRLSEKAPAGGKSSIGTPQAALTISTIHHATVSARTSFDADSEFPESGSIDGAFNLVHELGQNPTIYPDELGVPLPANSFLTWRLHTHANGKETTVRVDLGFKLHPKGYKPKHTLMTAGLGGLQNNDLDIPPGDTNARFDAYSVVRTYVKLLNFEPHMHASGKRMCLEAIFPSGTRQTLNCAGYNHNWVKVYLYEDDAAPLLPPMTILHAVGWYDNSGANPRNIEPRNWKGFGNRTIDDMMSSGGKYIELTEAEYKAELAARREKAQRRSTN
jgi:hypothetical protein